MVEFYVRDIINALKNQCYYSALALALALPDICGAAEYPDEPSTGKRYIEWFDKYLGEYLAGDDNAPFLSGEVIFCLRNTFLHSGAPKIDGSRIKDETNRLDQFLLIAGDGTKIWSMSSLFATPDVTYRTMMVDITYLCQTICSFSLRYYQQNADKFHFDCAVITQERLFSAENAAHASTETDLIVLAKRLLNTKLKRMGQTVQLQEAAGEPIHVQKTQTFYPAPAQMPLSAPAEQKTPSVRQKKSEPDQREAQVRSFVDQHFKEKEYRQQKERIIQAILRSKTKQQVNNALMQSFPSEETGAIYRRISSLIASLPGR